jgi:hypothetical protein
MRFREALRGPLEICDSGTPNTQLHKQQVSALLAVRGPVPQLHVAVYACLRARKSPARQIHQGPAERGSEGAQGRLAAKGGRVASEGRHVRLQAPHALAG